MEQIEQALVGSRLLLELMAGESDFSFQFKYSLNIQIVVYAPFVTLFFCIGVGLLVSLLGAINKLQN